MRILCSMLIAISLAATARAARDPFAFFQPTIVLSDADLESLRRGVPLVRFLPAGGHEVGAFTAIAVDPRVTLDRAAAWMRRLELLRENRYVMASQRLSNPPHRSDFDRVVLDDNELEEIRRCVPGRCGVKLAAADIELLRTTAAAGGNWKPLLQQAFREMLLRRVLTYTAGGLPALDDVVDKKRPVSPAAALTPLVEHTSFLGDRTPDLARRLARCATGPDGESESFIYWAKERLGGTPVITITHVRLRRGRAADHPPLMMVGTQVYASHYLDASLTVTAFMQDGPTSPTYFIYLHRSSVDLLGGFWGGIARSLIESKVRKDGPAILRFVGERLAGGDPPPGSARHGWPQR